MSKMRQHKKEDKAPTKKQRRRLEQEAPSDEDDDEPSMMPAALQRKVAAQAQLQQDEEMAEAMKATTSSRRPVARAAAPRDESDDDDDADDEFDDEEEEHGEYFEDVEDLELGEDDQRALDALMGGGGEKRQNLADIIMAKINEKAAMADDGSVAPDDAGEVVPDLPPKVLEVYTSVGTVLSRYRSGKLPKAFKIVPRLSNWEEILYATNPDGWTPAATSEATRLFASNLNHKMAQRFFNLVLLPAVQADIEEHGKLNFHLYLALKRALYKPQAFMKGLLLPLCEGRCTVREALIISSVLQKVSVPMLQSAAAILKLAEMEYSPATTLFLRTLLLKKYALPYRVVDALVEYFMGYEKDDEIPPVLWQQTLLAFAQHYKAEITTEQKERLKVLLREKPHAQITPEIRRELFSAKTRGDSYVVPQNQRVLLGKRDAMEE